jgi:hypothetical protein
LDLLATDHWDPARGRERELVPEALVSQVVALGMGASYIARVVALCSSLARCC